VSTATEALGQDTRGAVYLADADAKSLHHVVGMPAAYAEAVDGFQIGPESLACGLATHIGQPVLTTDVHTDPLWEPWRWLAERFDYRGCWSFPIHSAAGKFVGALAIYSRQPRQASERDRELMSLLTGTAAIIISQHMESAERKKAEEALRNSEARFRRFASASSVVYRMSPDWSEMRELDGRGFLSDTAEPTEAWMNRYIPHDDKADVAAAIRRAVRAKAVFELEHRVRRADGSVGWARSRAIPILDDRGEIVEWIGSATNVTQRDETDETALRRPSNDSPPVG
jgi:PAS domain-containing protein